VLKNTENVAREIRERFYDAKVRRKITLDCEWPNEVLFIGTGKSAMYQSDKWGGPDQPWKHIAESNQEVYLTKHAIDGLYDEHGSRFQFDDEEWFEVNGAMPKHLAVLAPSLGVQVKLSSGELFEIAIPATLWGATQHPDTGETYLVLFDKKHIYCLITGDELDVLEDGIVG
jgi:hypothetical protein